MDRDAIRNAVRKYIINDNSKYALLIDGTWGIGKTYLFENYLLDDIYDIEIGKNYYSVFKEKLFILQGFLGEGSDGL